MDPVVVSCVLVFSLDGNPGISLGILNSQVPRNTLICSSLVQLKTQISTGQIEKYAHIFKLFTYFTYQSENHPKIFETFIGDPPVYQNP